MSPAIGEALQQVGQAIGDILTPIWESLAAMLPTEGPLADLISRVGDWFATISDWWSSATDAPLQTSEAPAPDWLSSLWIPPRRIGKAATGSPDFVGVTGRISRVAQSVTFVYGRASEDADAPDEASALDPLQVRHRIARKPPLVAFASLSFLDDPARQCLS